ncbi:hypothetical protein G6F57_021463 [Rhizopus arrhizus]|nr:hypothetical protein G6F57_021463 [Rhizopus arrhizus]
MRPAGGDGEPADHRRRDQDQPRRPEGRRQEGQVVASSSRSRMYAQQFELREWPRQVWKHYYALPAEIWTDELLDCLGSPASGVLLLTNEGGQEKARVRSAATPNRDAKIISPAAAVDIARLASLRMWDAYARLEEREAA